MLQAGIIKHIITFDKECFPKDNVVMRALEFSMANQYIIDLSNNVQRGNRYKLEKGILPGRPPLGYLNHTEAYGDRSIIKDEQRFNLVKKMWASLLTSERIENILNRANNEWGLRTRKSRKQGGKPLSHSGIYYIFSDPFYAGIIQRKQDGEIREYKGIHEPMITLAEFEEAQYILGKKDRPRPKKHEFAYTGIIRCGECGCMITAEEKFKKTYAGTSHYIYYHCTKRKQDIKCQQGCIRVEDIEKQIISYLEKITINEKFIDWAIKYFDEVKDDKKNGKEILIYQKQTLQKTEISLKRLTDLLIEGILDKDEFSQKKQELLHQKWQLEEKIKQSETNQQNWLEPTKDLIFFSNQAKNWFISGNQEEKLEILKTIGSNCTLKDKTLQILAKKPFQIMEGFGGNPIVWARLDEVRTFFIENDSSDFFPAILKEKLNHIQSQHHCSKDFKTGQEW